MLVMDRIEDWLDLVDPWSAGELDDLLQAVLERGPVGLFDCAPSLDGRCWLVMAAHGEVLLCLEAQELPALAGQVAERSGPANARLDAPVAPAGWPQDGLHDERCAANESRPAPLWDADYSPRRSKA